MTKCTRAWSSLWSMIIAVILLAACGSESPEPEKTSSAIDGKLEAYVISYDDGTSAMEYTLETAEGRVYELELDHRTDLATGDWVRVIARSISDNRIVVESLTLLVDDDDVGSQQHALTGNAVRKRSQLAALLVHWGTPDSTTAADLRGRLFSNTNSTREFYLENSFNLLSLEGDVFGWFQVPAMSNCDYRTLATNARNAAAAAGVNISSYNQILYYFPRSSQCGWSGLASVGTPSTPSRDTWYNGSKGCVVLAQELLHNFGAKHSRSYRCSSGGSSVPLASASSCTYSEYGDPFDPMGGGCYHVNSYQKSSQGWFGKCNAVTVSSDSEWDIVPTNLASDGIQTVRVPMPASLCPSDMTSCYYYLEYRQPIGRFDSAFPTAQIHRGVLVHVGPGVNFSGGARPANPYLLDMTPGSSSAFRDPALVAGATYADPSGIRITTLSADSARARVRIQFPGGGSGGAVCIDGSQPGGTPPPPPPPPPPTSGCASGELAFEGQCYFLTSTATTYDQAKAACQARGSGWGLAEIGSAAENNFVAGAIGSAERWLGGNDRTTEGQWLWDGSGQVFWSGGLNGGPVSGAYANFVSGEPNDINNSDCLRMIAGGSWRDVACTSSFRAVCERLSKCPAGETEFGGHCYALTSAASTYDQAQSACQARGTGYRLATVTSATENSFISSLLGTREAWLGGTDRVTEGEWGWDATGQKFWTGGLGGSVVSGAYASFVSDEPNDANGSDCLRMISGGGWRDIQCTSSYYGVCESL